jgi:pyruvate/2-oxoglutarate dehydrogenase complex dihydrolipoamide acyltransferase (E2) component
MTNQRKEVLLVDLGEGLEEAQIVELLVKPGDRVKRLDPLLSVETDKAQVEVTSAWSGVVAAILVAPGDWVRVGSPMLVIDADA